jgi:DNA-binding NtrC family response regulator
MHLSGKPQVMVVDDDLSMCSLLKTFLDNHGYSAITLSNAEEAVRRYDAERPAAVILDLVMPGQDGMAVVRALREKRPEMKVALLTGYAHSPLLAAAQRQGVAVFMKPTPIHEVVEFLQSDES